MPLLNKSGYIPSFLCRNGHVSTLYSGTVQRSVVPDYKRIRLTLPDRDFLLIDYRIKSPGKAVILCHGLEGSSRSGYINRAARYFLNYGYSVFAWNNRSCGGAMNPGIRLYHHGETEDLNRVVDAVLQRGFNEVFLLGYSMGGAQLLNYFGRCEIDRRVKGGVAISAPVSLESSAKRMEHGLSKVYRKRFIGKIRSKVLEKAEHFPGVLEKNKVRGIRSFEDLAQSFIVPVYGFRDLDEFYHDASPFARLEDIQTQTLIINAKDDPIIGQGGYPIKVARDHRSLFLEIPKYGGHCGFPIRHKEYGYSEWRALKFFNSIL